VQYINLNRLEFVITNACSGKCHHCSNGEQNERDSGVDADAAVNAVRRLAERFDIQSVMTFGGEPLLYSDTVCKIHTTARDCGIDKRQLITNGFFSSDASKTDDTAKSLYEAGVNDILLSVDAFHQEYIPIEPVMLFADALIRHNIPSLQVQPAWLVNCEHDNKYNAETKRILSLFAEKGIKANEGNNIFASGNALKNFHEYFTPPEELDLSVPCGSEAYTERLDEVSCFGINPNGDVTLCSVTIGNIYNSDVLDIVNKYDPCRIPAVNALINDGIPALLRYAESLDVTVDMSDCRSVCGVCRKVMSALLQNYKNGKQ